MRKVIDTITAYDGSKAELVQKGQNLYCLNIVSRHTGHNRWGNWREIQEDVQYFKDSGRLPVSGPRW